MSLNPELLRTAAAIIRENADMLRESHCTPPEFDLGTMEPEVREVYAREMAVADRLYAAAAGLDQGEKA